MLDRGMTADLLEANLLLLEDRMPEATELPAAMRSAMRHLREGEVSTLYSREEVEGFAGALATGAEIACYLETKSYYKPEGAIVYAVRAGWARMTTSSGMVSNLSLDDYNRTWRLWAQFPGGHERHAAEWEQ